MARIYVGATLMPHFREFLPTWVGRQPWYVGAAQPSLTPIGYFRFEDPAGEVGIETHLVTDGSTVYQLPLTYRGAPLAGADHALVATAEHSVLGTRWIYDAVVDPVWITELLRLVRTSDVSDPSGKRGVAPAEARGRLLAAHPLTPATVHIDLRRVLADDVPEPGQDVVGLVTGTWHPQGPDSPPAAGLLATVRANHQSSQP